MQWCSIIRGMYYSEQYLLRVKTIRKSTVPYKNQGVAFYYAKGLI